MHLRLGLVLPLVLAACATGPETAESPSDRPTLVCEKTPPTGSRIARQFCWTSEEAASAKADARRMTEGYQRTRSVQKESR
jgi:hypothetical protein